VLTDWVEHFFVGGAAVRRQRERRRRPLRALGRWRRAREHGDASRSCRGVSRIGPVFTPRAVRGHGYGSAVTAAAADLARRGGVDDVVLFAGLANPISTASTNASASKR
jgi:predicted GNAT family acetyltransferase